MAHLPHVAGFFFWDRGGGSTFFVGVPIYVCVNVHAETSREGSGKRSHSTGRHSSLLSKPGKYGPFYSMPPRRTGQWFLVSIMRNDVDLRQTQAGATTQPLWLGMLEGPAPVDYAVKSEQGGRRMRDSGIDGCMSDNAAIAV